jgi:hypothetical protein
MPISDYANKDGKLAAKSLFQLLMGKMASAPTTDAQPDPQYAGEPMPPTKHVYNDEATSVPGILADLPVRGPFVSHDNSEDNPLINGTSVPFPIQGQTLGPSAHPLTIGKPREMPFETFQRLTGMKWHGGASPEVADLMSRLGVEGKAGSAEANLALQKALLANAKNLG